MERCVGKEKVSRNKLGGAWATAKETSLEARWPAQPALLLEKGTGSNPMIQNWLLPQCRILEKSQQAFGKIPTQVGTGISNNKTRRN